MFEEYGYNKEIIERYISLIGKQETKKLLEANTNINNLMLEMGYAKSYDGKKKVPWSQSELQSILYHIDI